jgi:anti-anti-sigma factor
MHITPEPREEHAILHLRGEFDTFYAPLLQQEVDALVKAGIVRVVLNLRWVRYINSTALGALAKIRRQLEGQGGKLAISRPSAFCKDMLGKVGLDRVIGIYDSDEAAGEAVLEGSPAAGAKRAAASEGEGDGEVTTVLFSPMEKSRIDHFLPEAAGHKKVPVTREALPAAWSGAGRMLALDPNGMRFTWNGGTTGLAPFSMAQFLAIGTDWSVKFRLPMLAKGYREAICTVTEVEERPDGVRVGTQFKELDAAAREEIRQYAKDLAYLKEELRRSS